MNAIGLLFPLFATLNQFGICFKIHFVFFSYGKFYTLV